MSGGTRGELDVLGELYAKYEARFLRFIGTFHGQMQFMIV